MINYRDMTFCQGAGCTKFNNCPRALTEQVLMEAKQWWGSAGAPVAKFANPRLLECYSGDGKQFLTE